MKYTKTATAVESTSNNAGYHLRMTYDVTDLRAELVDSHTADGDTTQQLIIEMPMAHIDTQGVFSQLCAAGLTVGMAECVVGDFHDSAATMLLAQLFRNRRK